MNRRTMKKWQKVLLYACIGLLIVGVIAACVYVKNVGGITEAIEQFKAIGTPEDAGGEELGA